MKEMKFVLDGHNLTRVNKTTARKLYEKEEKEIFVIPCLANPDNPWRLGGYLTPTKYNKNHFDDICAYYSFHNCNRELGKYLSFFVKESGVV